MRPAAGGAPGRRIGWLLALVPAGFITVLFVWPVTRIIVRGLAPGGRPDLGVFLRVAGDGHFRGVVWFTIWLALVSTVLTLIAGMPAAWALGRFEFRGRSLLRSALLVPFVMPTVVVGTAFVDLLGRDGILGLDLRDTVWAILIAHVFFNVAVVIRTVGDAWSRLDPSQNEVARVLGASPQRAFRTVTLPALAPAVLAAAAIVFLFSFTSFGVVLILGGPTHTTLEVETYVQTTVFLNLDVAAVLALTQMALIVTGLGMAARLDPDRRRHPVGTTVTGRQTRRRMRSMGERVTVGGVLGITGGFLALPLALLAVRSLRSERGWTLDNYRGLARGGTTLFVPPLTAVANSLMFAVGATLVATLIGGLAAAAVGYGRGRVVRLTDAVLMLPLGTSAATVGFGILITFDRPPLDLRASPWLVPLAHALIGIPFVVRLLVPAVRRIDPRLREVAATLGASPRRVWTTIDAVLLRRPLVAAAGFAFAVSLGEFGATSFISRPEFPTAPVAIFRFLSRPGAANIGRALAMSTILMLLTAGSVALIEFLGGSELSRGPRFGGGGRTAAVSTTGSPNLAATGDRP